MSSYVVGLFGVLFRGCSGSVWPLWACFCNYYLLTYLSYLSLFLLVVVLAVVLVAGGVVVAMAMVIGLYC